MKRYILLICLILFTSSYAQLELENAFPALTFTEPVDIQSAKDSTHRLFIIEQTGKIKLFPNSSSASNSKVFLDLTSEIISGGELGLLGLAFHPQYKSNGFFYVDYTTSISDTIYSRVSRFQVSSTNPDSADINSELILLTQKQPNPNHNGGHIAFGPDGFLYIAFGDGGSASDPLNNGQNKATWLGKLLRIDVNTTSPGRNYGIPSGNPFAANTQGFKEEIYAWGFRNPWRFSFDPLTNWLWCADVGQSSWEEIDLVQNDRNYGWRCYEGNHPYNTLNCNDTYTYPVWEYDHSGGNCSITGGVVYRGSSVPELYGKYIYADYCSRNYWSLLYDSSAAPVNTFLFTAPSGAPVGFGTDENNEMYICGYDGVIYRFKPTSVGIQDNNKEISYYLEQNYPNPFNPSTSIRYSVPEESNVKLEIINALGIKVAELFNGIKESGQFQVLWNASGFASGIYFIGMTAQSRISSKEFSKIIKTAFIK